MLFARPWVRLAMLVGVGYAFVGIIFPLPTSQVWAWRLAAWILSAIGYGAHTMYEYVGLGNSPRLTATRVSSAAAFGAFLIAGAAIVRSLFVGGGPNTLLGIAIVAWPAITGVSAFLVALVTTTALDRIRGE